MTDYAVQIEYLNLFIKKIFKLCDDASECA